MARVAICLGDDFEDSEFQIPYRWLEDAGHELTIVGENAGATVIGKAEHTRVKVERDAADISADDYDVLVIPGGYSPDHLRLDRATVAFTRDMIRLGRLVAAICHGPQLLIEADVVSGRTLTSWPSIRTDLENAGAIWVDREVVEDGNLITARKPEDLDAFCGAIETRLSANPPHNRIGGSHEQARTAGFA